MEHGRGARKFLPIATLKDITGADGKFSITDVPPGNYTLVAIQSFTGPIQQPVTVTAGKPTNLTIELKKQ